MRLELKDFRDSFCRRVRLVSNLVFYAQSTIAIISGRTVGEAGGGNLTKTDRTQKQRGNLQWKVWYDESGGREL